MAKKFPSWKGDAVEYSDFRHTKGEPEEPKHHGKRKPKYCKKLKGPHIEASEPLSHAHASLYEIRYCLGCGKHLRYGWIKLPF